MKTVVLVVHLQIPEDQDARSYDLGMIELFGKTLANWSAYTRFEDNAPIRISIDSNGFEEI